MVVVLVIAGLAYFNWDKIIAKKNEMALKTFKKAQEDFWKKNKRFQSKEKIQRIFERAEKGIIDGTIDSVEYEALARKLSIMSRDQKVIREEVNALEGAVDTWISGTDSIIRP